MPRSCWARRRRGPADRQLPSRRRRVAVRDRRRPLGRHDDGLHAARGSRDGDPLGQRRSGAAAVAARSATTITEPSSRTLARARVGAARPGAAAPTCARCWRARRRRPDAGLALDVYVHRCALRSRRWRPALGGTRRARRSPAGVGERSPEIRARAVEALGFLGVSVAESANRSSQDDDVIGARVLVIHAREDLEMARQARALISR